MPSLETTFCGVRLPTPLVNGSGTLDALVSGTLGFSAFVTKTVTLNPREGNPPPRIAETPSGMVNSIGLANPGLDRFLEHDLPRLAELGVPIIASVGGWSPGEYATAVARIGAHPAVVAIELNVSCPNVESGCISIGTDPGETRSLVERCRDETDVPVLAKLSPSVDRDRGHRDGGRRGWSARARPHQHACAESRSTGRRCGRSWAEAGVGCPARRSSPWRSMPSTTRTLRRAFRSSGWGAWRGPQDASEFLAAGATLVGIGTALFRDPGVVGERRPSSSPTSSGEGRADRATWWPSPTHPPQPQVELECRGAEFRLFRRFFSGCTPSGHGYNRPLR